MATTYQDTTGNGSNKVFNFGFPYLQDADVKVTINQVQIASTEYAVSTGPTKITFNNNSITSAVQETDGSPKTGLIVRVYRDTEVDTAKAVFASGSSIRATDLNNNQDQFLYAAQEQQNLTVAKWQIEADAIDGTKLADDSVDSEHFVDGGIDTAHIADAAVTGAKIASGTFTTANISDSAVTTAKIANEAITSAKIANATIQAADIANDAISATQIGTGAVTTAKLGADAVTGAKIADDAVDSEHLAADSIDSEHYAANSVDADALAHTSVTAGTYTAADITVDAQGRLTSASSGAIATTEITDGAVTTAKLDADAITAAKIADDAVTTDHIADAELTTLAGMQSGTASILAGGTALAATLTEINTVCDGKGVQTTLTDDDTKYPTSGAVVDYVAAQIAPLGGLEVIATEVAFPNTQPASGVVISISDAGGVVFNGSGVSTTGRTVGGSTVTINSAPSSLYSETLVAGVGLMVSSTGSSQTYTYHKILGKEDDIKQLSDDINDFNARYRVNAGEPGSSNDEGDLVYDTNANKMKVYDGSSWGEVTSTGDFKFLVPVDAGTTTAATWDGSDTSFDLKEGTNSGSAAAITSVYQIMVSVNGVIQKPNTGSWSGSGEGFYLTDSDTIRFATAPPTGSSVFIIQFGSALNATTPADNTVATAKIQNLAVTGGKIADDTITEGKLDVSNAPTNGQFLQAQSGEGGGLTWASVTSTPEGTAILSTGESGGTKFLREDGDGSSSWQSVPAGTPTTTRGDIIYRAASADARLAKGTAGQYLKIGANDPEWADVVAATADGVLWENNLTISNNYTIAATKGAHSVGPITNNATVTVNGRWVIS